MAGALAGLRVLDLADRSGLFCGRLLAELGADVVLVEPPGGHEWRAPGIAPDLFRFYAAGRRSLVLDLASSEGRRQFAELAARADVVVETGPPGRAAALRREHPHLVVTSITAFGQDGPRCAWRANDLVAQALGGMVFVNGHPDGPPLRALGLQAYHQAGIFAAIGTLAALHSREATGHGQLVDVSLQAAVAGALEHVSGLWHQNGEVPQRQGTLHWTRFFATVACLDGHLLISTLGDWTSLLEWLKADGCQADLEARVWEDATYRKEHAEHLFAVLGAWAAGRRVDELAEGAQLRRLPFAPVRAPDALRSDQHLIARGFATEMVRHGGPAFRLRGWTPLASAPAPEERAAPAWSPRPVPLSASAPSPGTPPLAGIRVLDFTWVVAGPVATRILADLGADVVKVERRDAQHFGDRRGGLSGTLMRGKRSIGLDLGRERGRELARELARGTDVVIDNYSARVMDNLGLDYGSLRPLNPRIIAVRMTGFGLVGPHRDHVSYGPTLQALTGYSLLMREPGQPPAGFGYSYSDLAGGNLGALAVLGALAERQRTGEGQLVDFAQLEAVASLLGPLDLAAASGNATQEGPAAPHGVYPTADPDGWIAIAIFDDREWHRLASLAGDVPWACDPRFATLGGRMHLREELDHDLAVWTRTRTRQSLMEALQAVQVAAGLVADARDLCRDDPQLAARGYFVERPTPEGRVVRVDGPPFLLSETPARVRGPGPLLGEHTDQILAALGTAPAEIAALRADGVVF